MDEPTGNLDDDTTQNLLALLKEYAQKGIKFLVITHDNRVTSVFDNVLTIENQQITCSNTFEGNECVMSEQEKIKLAPNLLYNVSKKRNKKHFIMNTIVVTIALTCVIIISLFLFSENNQFIDKINKMFNTRAGTINIYHLIQHQDGECDKVMEYTMCGDGEPPIPGYEGFTKEEEEYLKNYEGMENISFLTNDNDIITYENSTLDEEDLRKNMDNYMNSTGDAIFKEGNYSLQPSLLFAQPSILSNMGTFVMPETFFKPIAGGVHDLEPNEIVLPESYAKALAYKEGISVEDLIGNVFEFKSYNTTCVNTEDSNKTCITPQVIDYKVAWVYPAEEGMDFLYLPPLAQPEKQKVDLDYSVGNQMFFMSGIDDFLKQTLDSLNQFWNSELKTTTSNEDYKKILNGYIEANSSIESKRKALQTGDTISYYLFKDGYSQKDFMEYVENGPDPLKYREFQNPYILLKNKSYNDNYQRMYIVMLTMGIASIVVLILQNIYLKIIINELRLARLMGYEKMSVKKILVKHLVTSLAIEVLIASISSAILLGVINLFVRPILINFNNIVVLMYILTIIGLISLYCCIENRCKKRVT